MILSPAFIFNPSVTTRRSPIGIKYSLKLSGFVKDLTLITRICFFLVGNISILPSISESIAFPFGFLASNSSCTLGRPPVMSLVPSPNLIILAMMSPFLTLAPSLTIIYAP